MLLKDYYAVLGVKPDATRDGIKKAYRKAARKYHPDIYKGPDAETRFDEIADAYQVLSDPIKRRAFDRTVREERKKAGEEFQEMRYPTKFSKTGTDRVSHVGGRPKASRRDEADFDRFGELSQIWYDRFVQQKPSYTEGVKKKYGERYSRIPTYKKQRFTVHGPKYQRQSGPVEFKHYDSIHRERHGSTGHSGIVKRSYAYHGEDDFTPTDDSMMDDFADGVIDRVSSKSMWGLALVLITFFAIMAFILLMVIS